MPLLSFGGWDFGVPLANLMQQAMNLARVYTFNNLGGNNVYLQNQRIAEMVNWTIQKLLEANPDLAKAEDTISMPNAGAGVLGTNVVAIPATMYGQDVTTMQFTDNQQNQYTKSTQCLYLDRNGVLMLPITWQNGTYTARNPAYWSWDENSKNQMFWPFPNSTSCQITRTYRIKPTPVVANYTGPFQNTGYPMPGLVTTYAGGFTVYGTGTWFTDTMTPLSGVLTTASASAIVVGTNTFFLNELTPGDVVSVGTVAKTVLSIADDTHFTATSVAGQVNTAQPAWKIGGTTTSHTVSLAVGDPIIIAGNVYIIENFINESGLTVTTPTAAAAAQTASKGVMIGEIPVRFNMVPAYRLAAYLCEDIDSARYADMMTQYAEALKDMQDQITKQISAWNAGYSQEASPNQLFSVQACFPYVGSGGVNMIGIGA